MQQEELLQIALKRSLMDSVHVAEGDTLEQPHNEGHDQQQPHNEGHDQQLPHNPMDSERAQPAVFLPSKKESLTKQSNLTDSESESSLLKQLKLSDSGSESPPRKQANLSNSGSESLTKQSHLSDSDKSSPVKLMSPSHLGGRPSHTHTEKDQAMHIDLDFGLASDKPGRKSKSDRHNKNCATPVDRPCTKRHSLFDSVSDTPSPLVSKNTDSVKDKTILSGHRTVSRSKKRTSSGTLKDDILDAPSPQWDENIYGAGYEDPDVAFWKRKEEKQRLKSRINETGTLGPQVDGQNDSCVESLGLQVDGQNDFILETEKSPSDKENSSSDRQTGKSPSKKSKKIASPNQPAISKYFTPKNANQDRTPKSKSHTENRKNIRITPKRTNITPQKRKENVPTKRVENETPKRKGLEKSANSTLEDCIMDTCQEEMIDLTSSQSNDEFHGNRNVDHSNRNSLRKPSTFTSSTPLPGRLLQGKDSKWTKFVDVDVTNSDVQNNNCDILGEDGVESDFNMLDKVENEWEPDDDSVQNNRSDDNQEEENDRVHNRKHENGRIPVNNMNDRVPVDNWKEQKDCVPVDNQNNKVRESGNRYSSLSESENEAATEKEQDTAEQPAKKRKCKTVKDLLADQLFREVIDKEEEDAFVTLGKKTIGPKVVSDDNSQNANTGLEQGERGYAV